MRWNKSFFETELFLDKCQQCPENTAATSIIEANKLGFYSSA